MELAAIGLFMVVGAIGIFCFVFWIWMLIDCATNEPAEGNDKLIWILIILFAQLIGALIYFFVRRPERRRRLGR